MKKITLIATILFFALGAQAQFLPGIYGVVFDTNQTPVANMPIDIEVFCFNDSTTNNFTVITNNFGEFADSTYYCEVGLVTLTYTCPGDSIPQTITQQFSPNTGGGVFFTLLCDGNQNPWCNVTIDYSNSPINPYDYFFAANVGGGGTPPYTYAWYFNNGAVITGQTAEYTFPQDGVYDVTVLVTDANGSACSDSVVIDINGGGNQDSCWVDIWTGQVNGLTVDFNSIVFPPDPNMTYAWDFGDNNASTVANPTHTYAAGGVYTACLTVTDPLGNTCVQCISIIVEEPEVCDDNELTLTLTLDNFPAETSWDLVDANGNVVASGGNYGAFPDGTTLTETACVEDGCYFFNIYDTFGDGICCTWGQGGYTLSDAANNVLASGGAFGSFESTAIPLNTQDSCVVPIDTTEQCIDWSLINLGASCPGYDPVCGCDGVTYSNACIAEECFGVAIYTEGPCDGNGNGNNGGGGNPTDTTCTLNIGFQYFGFPLDTTGANVPPFGEWGYAFFSNVTGGTAPYVYQWDLGNGVIATTPDAATTYTEDDSLQSYTVCLTVFDAQQCAATVCETIVVDTDPNGNIGGTVAEDGGLNFGQIVRANGPGDPLPNVHVVLLDPAGNLVQETYTDAAGGYHFFNLQFGDYYVWVDIPGVEHTPEHVKINPIVQYVDDLGFQVGDDGVTTSIETITFANEIKVFPNPATDFVNVNIHLTEASELTIVLQDVLGRQLLTQIENLPSGYQTVRMEGSDILQGIYMLSIYSGNEVYTEKVMFK